MGHTSRPGVFVAGAATGPETIDDSIAQGHAAAMSVLSDLHQPIEKSA
jgi:heterodisulfide reductase subunit A